MDIRTISTDGHLPQKRLEYWNTVTSAALTYQIAEPADPSNFRGRLRSASLGKLRLAELSASASVVLHTRSHIAQSRESPFLLRLPLVGHMTIVQGSLENTLRTGDYALCDSAQPYKLLTSDDCVVFTVCIPRPILKQYIALPETVTSIVMPGGQGAAGMTARFLMHFWAIAEAQLEATASERFETIALQLIAASYASLPRSNITRSTFAAKHRVSILQYIEEHLTDPELTPQSIADALRITPSYAHRSFSSEDESMARYILKRRLEECARALRDPLLATQSITSIAFGRGFNSPTHFAKVFRERFDMSPREFRSNRLNA